MVGNGYILSMTQSTEFSVLMGKVNLKPSKLRRCSLQNGLQNFLKTILDFILEENEINYINGIF